MNKFEKTIRRITESTSSKPAGAYGVGDIEETYDADEFADAQKRANDKRTDDSLQLYIMSPSEAQEILDDGGKLFVTNDGLAGAYVKSDGYMGGLFRDPSSPKNRVAKPLQQVRTQAGGYFFDAFATYLEDIYIENGFRPVARMTFNPEYAPSGWESTNLAKKPDNVFFVYDPDYNATKGEGVRIEDFDEAYEYARYFNTDKEEVDLMDGVDLAELDLKNDK